MIWAPGPKNRPGNRSGAAAAVPRRSGPGDPATPEQATPRRTAPKRTTAAPGPAAVDLDIPADNQGKNRTVILNK